MKIALNGTSLESQLSGIGKYTLNLMRGLMREKIDIVVYFSKKPKYFIENRYVENKIIKSPNKYLFENFYLPKNIVKDKAEIYHATSSLNIPGTLTTPSILSIHDIIPITQKNYFNHSKFPKFSKNLFYLRSKIATKKSKKIIASSFCTKKALVKHLNINSKKIITIYPAIESPKSKKTNILNRFQLTPKQYILNNGGIAVRKNLLNLIRAFSIIHKKNPNLKFVITGKKHKTYFYILKKEIKKHKLSKTVIFTDYINEKNLWTLIKNALLVCYPSMAEGFGIPILEAFQNKTPIILSNLSIFREIAKNNSALFVDQQNPNLIAKEIIALAENSSLRSLLVKRGEERAKDFSWEKTTRQIIEVYKEVLSKN